MLKRAKGDGILVINIDNKLDADTLKQAGLQIPFVGPNNRDCAKRVGEVLAKKLQSGDEVTIIEGVTTAFNSQHRRLRLLTANPGLKALLCANDSMAPGAAAVQSAQKAG